jgi:hypothetical protein
LRQELATVGEARNTPAATVYASAILHVHP